jgi:hypothetical protein
MTRNELIAQFLLNAATADSEAAIGEALKTLPTDAISHIADIIADICRAKRLDPLHRAIQAVYTQTAEYKAAREAETRRTALDRAVTGIEVITQAYRENVQCGAIPTAEQVEAEAARLTRAVAGLGAVGPQRRIYTPADYMTECLTYDPSRDFSPALFGGLAFPDGTASYIGARTSRGKTTAMVNLARDALAEKAATQRPVIFITLEMSGKQILNKLILSTALAMGINRDGGEKGEIHSFLASIPNPGKEIYHVWKKEPIPGIDREGPDVFRLYVKNAYRNVEAAQKEGRFTLYDGRGASEAEIISFMKACGEAGAVILLDYIQKMPPKDGADADSFRRVQAISYDVVNAAAASNAVVIAGAQFNRLGGTDGLGDVFTDESFRECGDLEQDAHNAIGIGWKTDKQGRFYEILKTREDRQQGSVFDIDFDGAYSYMAQGEQTYRPEKRERKNNGEDNRFVSSYRGRTIME